MSVFILAIGLLAVSAALALCARSGSIFWDRVSLLAGFGGVLSGMAATVYCLIVPAAAVLRFPWPAIGGDFFLRLDPLAAIFLLPAFFIAGAGFLYGTSYWPARERPGSSAWIRFFYPLLAAGIAVLLTAGNGVLFLFGWEIMTLAGYFLVVTERHDEETLQAGFIYLIATHTGTLALFGMFALLGAAACLTSLPVAGTVAAGTASATGIFLLALVGFGFKAGIIPLHIWLPRAHAAAPSHVSALMSGVMIKTGIYGILRITSLFSGIPSWWGWLVLGLGIVSGILGVLFAIAQHDIKRLLAYHSVENIGIILIGIGMALLGRSHGLAAATVLGLAGALLHVVNHGLFKGLLFLSAGSVIRATDTRQLSFYGGLLQAMPFTALFFLTGSVAICGLPPLNGFVSEWLVYLGLLHGGIDASGVLIAVLPAMVGLALIGGLALLCFAKVFGLAFLGMPRQEHSVHHEAPRSMLAAMALLAVPCLWIGVLPGTVQPLLDAGIGSWLASPPAPGLTLAALAPAGYISMFALLLAAAVGGILLHGNRVRHGKTPLAETWGCGYSQALPRARYSTSSFAESIMRLFRWILRTRLQQEKTRNILPPAASFKSHTPDLVLDLAAMPIASLFAGAAVRARRLLQHGMIGVYLLYTVAALGMLFFIVSRLP